MTASPPSNHRLRLDLPRWALGYAVATVLFLPGAVITLAGGALFGPVWGTFYNLTGATIGATLAFVIARYLAADWVARRPSSALRWPPNFPAGLSTSRLPSRAG